MCEASHGKHLFETVVHAGNRYFATLALGNFQQAEEESQTA